MTAREFDTRPLFTVYARVAGAIVGFTARGDYADAVAFMLATGTARRHDVRPVTEADADAAAGNRGDAPRAYAAYRGEDDAPAPTAPVAHGAYSCEDYREACEESPTGEFCNHCGAFLTAAPRARRTYTANRVVTRLYEYVTVDADGTARPSSNDDDFNDMPYYHYESIDAQEFDSVADMVAAIRRDYVSFAAYGDGMTASDPDGSQIIDYVTGERESVSWHLDAVSPALLGRVIVPAVDAR